MESTNASECLKAVLDEALVKDDEATIFTYSAGITGTIVKPACIVFPQSEKDVINIVKAAVNNNLKLYPVSRGKNFGYGDAQGTQPSQVIVDLSGMTDISHNEKLAYVTIQPGVSQEQLYTYLIKSGSSLQADVTGAGLAASIAGNILERGFGHTDYGDRFARLITMNIVLADGSLIKTGFSQFENNKSDAVYRYGTGPSIDGLFSQSPFGIVTEMTIELMPRPEKMLMFVFSTKNEKDIGNLAEAVRTLKLNGICNSAIHIANKSRAIGDAENKFAGAWNMSGSISGPASLVRARKKIVRRIISQYIKRKKLWFISDGMMNLLSWFHHKVMHVAVYDPLKDAFDLQKGIPTDNPLRTLLNDNKLNSAAISASSYNTCFSWINAVCSAEAESVSRLLNLVKKKFDQDGYELRVTFTAINPRALIMIANISYSREAEAIKKGIRFCSECSALLNENGFYPYRAGTGSYEKMPERRNENKAFLTKLRAALDPQGIIAPGKYNI